MSNPSPLFRDPKKNRQRAKKKFDIAAKMGKLIIQQDGKMRG